MRLVTNDGHYRGDVLEWGVSLSSGGFPQFVAQCSAVECYDEETGTWQPWGQYEEGATAYLVLAGKDGKPTKNVEQVKKVFEWDGVSLQALALADHSKVKIQFRVDIREYDGKERKQVNWIDVYDATPSSGLGTVEKLDPAKLAAIDNQFGDLLKVISGGKVATAKPPSKAPDVPAKRTRKRTKTAAPETATPVESPKEEKAAAPPAPPERTTKAAKQYDKIVAWNEVVAATPNTDEGERAVVWNDMVEQITPGKDDNDVTQKEWAEIVKETIEACGPQ